jgi:hypothetical protein
VLAEEKMVNITKSTPTNKMATIFLFVLVLRAVLSKAGFLPSVAGNNADNRAALSLIFSSLTGFVLQLGPEQNWKGLTDSVIPPVELMIRNYR